MVAELDPFSDHADRHQPRAWTGIRTQFGYDIDSRMYPTFEERAAYAHRQAITVITPKT